MKQISRKRYNELMHPKHISAEERFKKEPYQLRYQRLLKEQGREDGEKRETGRM